MRIRLGLIVTFVGVIGILLDSGHPREFTYSAAEMVASCGFLITAWAAGAVKTASGRLIFVGLCFGWWGDWFLLHGGTAFFIAGLVSFLIDHVFCSAAFVVRGVRVKLAVGASVIMAVSALTIGWWILPHVTGSLVLPAAAYTLVISAMLALAFGAWRGKGGPIAAMGALAFYISDIFVARGRFLTSDGLNVLFGTPLYYLGQSLLALSIAYARIPLRDEVGVGFQRANPLGE